MTLVPTTTDETARQTALLQAVGLDKLAPAQRELALNIAQRYDLDLLLKHLVMIDGRAYITRDGLLHVAHRSGDFDGMETTEPSLGDDGFWRSTCSIYRKTFTRPFTYTGRYPKDGRNRQYAPEMAIKVGEVMALRRAFDVSAPAYEERWAGDLEDAAEPVAEPSSLADRIAERAASIADPEPFAGDHAVSVSPGPDGTVVVDDPVVDKPKTANEARAAARRAKRADRSSAPTETQASPSVLAAPSDEEPAGMTLEQFASAVLEFKRDDLRALAKATFPDAKSFGQLSDAQRLALYDRAVAELEPIAPAEPVAESGGPDAPPDFGPMPVEVSDATPYVEPDEPPTPEEAYFRGAPRAAVAPTYVERDDSGRVVSTDSEACGAPSAWTAGVTCLLPARHVGAHRSGNESW